MNVHWTNHALNHLVEIYQYIKTDSPRYALRVVDRITQRSKQIADFPRSGRRVPEYDHPDIREVFEGSYRVIYRIKKNQIDVLSVIHSSQEDPFD